MISAYSIDMKRFKNNIYHYYDTFALISDKNINFTNTDNKCIYNNCIYCMNYRKNHKINLPNKYLIDYKKI